MAPSKKALSSGDGGRTPGHLLEVELTYLPVQGQNGVDILFSCLANVHLMLLAVRVASEERGSAVTLWNPHLIGSSRQSTAPGNDKAP
jgi:hypothetical protein